MSAPALPLVVDPAMLNDLNQGDNSDNNGYEYEYEYHESDTEVGFWKILPSHMLSCTAKLF